MYYDLMTHETGTIAFAVDDAGVRHIDFQEGNRPLTIAADWQQGGHPLLAETRAQLAAYFAGDLQEFDLPLAPHGTAFYQKVWRALTEIPYGESRSYSELAGQLDMPKASRAVGAANGRNPISIIIPCHRVIGKSGKLTGYAGGIPIKSWLLDHERANC